MIARLVTELPLEVFIISLNNKHLWVLNEIHGSMTRKIQCNLSVINYSKSDYKRFFSVMGLNWWTASVVLRRVKYTGLHLLSLSFRTFFVR